MGMGVNRVKWETLVGTVSGFGHHFNHSIHLFVRNQFRGLIGLLWESAFGLFLFSFFDWFVLCCSLVVIVLSIPLKVTIILLIKKRIK